MNISYLCGLLKNNIILGKNGCGKSYILKKIRHDLTNNKDVGLVRYISPERGGQLSYNSSILDSIQNDPSWLGSQRNSNQVANFRMQSVAQFRNLELKILRGIEKEHTQEGYTPTSFDKTLVPFGSLLDRIRLERADPTFNLHKRSDNSLVKSEQLSSGESELISLAIEVLSFRHDCDPEKKNYILIDEPDVHLHPDLQARLAVFLTETLKLENIVLIIATHSTSLLSALATNSQTSVAFMKQNDSQLSFISVNDELKNILPIFGAHPLSNIFNESPILLVEGDDDERIWQQAVRTSQGKIKLHPCVASSVVDLHKLEILSINVMNSVYDSPVGFSLRDRDGISDEITDEVPLVRMRLDCRTAENLLLTDDVLLYEGSNWLKLENQILQWIQCNADHSYFNDMQTFIEGGMDRKNADLKNIRNILNGFFTRKIWEVAVGQAIARLAMGEGLVTENSLKAYLGDKACKHLLSIETEIAAISIC